MTYRPQFVFSTPPGFRDEQFHYSFDGSNVAALSSANPLIANEYRPNIYLQLQNDAEFILRALHVQLATAVSNLNMELRDPYGNDLSAGGPPMANTFSGGGLPIAGRMFVPYEPEIRCPASGFLQLFLRNLTTGNVNPPALTLYGVKRYQERAA